MSLMNTITTYLRKKESQWLNPVQISSATLQSVAKNSHTIKKTLKTLKKLKRDDYLDYMIGYYKSGLKKFKKDWEYADILTHLQAIADLTKPKNYLEIGVRRGRSLAIVAKQCPTVDIYGFDLWVQNYAGMENPGSNFVKKELRRIGHKGKLTLVSGDSKETIPHFLNENPDLHFDMITIDGDHSEEGARIDLENTLPRLKIGGVLLLDDICHPQHLYLENLWDNMITQNKNFSSQKYTDLGYGVACAIRQSF